MSHMTHQARMFANTTLAYEPGYRAICYTCDWTFASNDRQAVGEATVAHQEITIAQGEDK